MAVKIISVSQTETDWTALYSVDGRQAQAITFPAGKRPLDAAILAAAQKAVDAQAASEAEQAASDKVDPSERWRVSRVVAGKTVEAVFPVGVRPTGADVDKAISAASVSPIKPGGEVVR
jgi:hypothetical protein